MKALRRPLAKLALLVGSLIAVLLMVTALSGKVGAHEVSAAPRANFTAPVSQDSWIDASQPAGNFGADAGLHVGLVMDPATGLMGERQILVQFDLSGLPPGSTIVNATLHLYQIAASGFDAYLVRPDAAAASWQEAAVTWNNRPPNPNLNDPAITLDYAVGWKQWDVTQIVRAWQNGQLPNFGIVLEGLTPVGAPPAAFTTASTLSSALANCSPKSLLSNFSSAFQPTCPAT